MNWSLTLKFASRLTLFFSAIILIKLLVPKNITQRYFTEWSNKFCLLNSHREKEAQREKKRLCRDSFSKDLFIYLFIYLFIIYSLLFIHFIISVVTIGVRRFMAIYRVACESIRTLIEPFCKCICILPVSYETFCISIIMRSDYHDYVLIKLEVILKVYI